MSVLTIPILLGTARENRESKKVAQFLFDQISNVQEIKTEIVDPRDFDFGDEVNFNATKDANYSRITAQADGFIIVCPEYNHSFPSSLKKMLDSELATYSKKPVALVGVSGGNWGGVRAIESLLPVLRALEMIVLKNDVHFAYVESLFDENNAITSDKYTDRVKRMLQDLTWMAKVMKYGKENIPSN